jgi:hypothetical protein
MRLKVKSVASSVECHGSETASVSATLREQGAIVLAMDVVCPSRYRLELHWQGYSRLQTNVAAPGILDASRGIVVRGKTPVRVKETLMRTNRLVGAARRGQKARGENFIFDYH